MEAYIWNARAQRQSQKSHPSEELSHILSFSNSGPPSPFQNVQVKDLVDSVLFSYSSLGFLPIWLILMHLSTDQLSVSVKAQTPSLSSQPSIKSSGLLAASHWLASPSESAGSWPSSSQNVSSYIKWKTNSNALGLATPARSRSE